MAIVGFNFRKIHVEKKQGVKGKVDINNNVSINNITQKDLSIGQTSKEKALIFEFTFTSKYTPAIGEIAFEGEVLQLSDAKTQEDILKSWKKDKSINKEVMTEILNAVLNRCNIQALVLSRDVNLPPPIPMPKVKQ